MAFVSDGIGGRRDRSASQCTTLVSIFQFSYSSTVATSVFHIYSGGCRCKLAHSRLRPRGALGLSLAPLLLPPGSASRGLRVVSESWAPALDSLMLEIS